MEHQIIVRNATIADAAEISRFNIAMAWETEQKRLNKSLVEEGVKVLCRTPEHGFYMAAEIDGLMVGTLMITKEWSDWRNGFFWWIQSVYVLPEYRRRGVYRKLYATIKTMAAEKEGVCGCRLYVEKENILAQQVYSKLGMEETRYKILEESFDRK
ncbi:N-acetyltransferase [Balneolaceae bacterium ANBcel3]|nr:N-acetyltransferase [Balneolaceae bacterium ANBcel3]